MGRSDVEKCVECGYQIPRTEQAYVFKGKIVCAECDKILRNGLNTRKEIPAYIEAEILNSQIHSGNKSHLDNQENLHSEQVFTDSLKDFQSVSEHKEHETENITNLLNEAEQKMDDKEISIGSDKTSYALSPEPGEEEFSDYIPNQIPDNDSEQLVIKLPSFVHSCYLEEKSSSNHSSIFNNHKRLNSFLLVIFFGAIAAVITVLLKRILF